MNRRSKLFINKKFQLQFIFMCLIPMFIMLVCFWLGIEFMFYKMINLGNKLGLASGHTFYQLLGYQKKELIFIVLLMTVISSIIFGVWALMFSHRIAGPIYRLSLFFSQLKKDESGKYPDLKFREGDYFSEVVNDVNKFLSSKDR